MAAGAGVAETVVEATCFLAEALLLYEFTNYKEQYAEGGSHIPRQELWKCSWMKGA